MELKPAVKSHLWSVGAGGRARLWSVPEMPTPVNIQRYRTFPSSAGTSGGHLQFKQTESSLAVLTNLNCVRVFKLSVSQHLKLLQQSFYI